MKKFFKVQRKFKGGFKVKTLKVKSISVMLIFTMMMAVFMPITASARTILEVEETGEMHIWTTTDGKLHWDKIEEASSYAVKIFRDGTNLVLDTFAGIPQTSEATNTFDLYGEMDNKEYEENSYRIEVYANGAGKSKNIIIYYNSPYSRLAQPTNLRWNGNTAEWDAVQNATSYHVLIHRPNVGKMNSKVLNGETSVDLSYLSPENGDFFTVIAMADGYRNSYANESPKKGANNVTFDLNGGTWTDTGTNPQVVNYGETAIRPTNPTKSGHVFAGWYADSACTTPFSFLTAITSNKTIYAKWDIITNSVNAILSPTPSVGLTIGDLVLTSGDSSKYSVSAGYWKLNDSGSALDKSSTQFEAGQTYTLYLTYYPEDGYNIPDDATYTVNGIPTEWSGFEAESNRKISFTIPAPATQISELSATVTAPVGGEHPSFTVTVPDGAHYTATVYAWYDLDNNGAHLTNSDTFVTGNEYQVRIHFTANTGYEINSASYTINGTPNYASFDTAEQRGMKFVATAPAVTTHIWGEDLFCKVCGKYKILDPVLVMMADGTWKYFVNGVWAKDTTTLHWLSGKWFFVENGVWSKASRFVMYKGVEFYVSGGKWDKNLTDLKWVDGVWYYIHGGKPARNVDKLHWINGKWFLVKQGVWKKTTGFVEHEGVIFYLQGGKWDKTLNTLIKKNGKYVAVKSGKKYTGKGIITYKGSKFYVNKGYAQLSYSGKVTIDGKKYTVKKGKIV